MTTPQELDGRFRRVVGALSAPVRHGDPAAPVRPGSPLSGGQALRLFEAMMASRHLDLAARWLRGFGEGFSTVGSAGHEGNAAVALACRPTDPALLHYRSGAFYCARSAQAGRGAIEAIGDVLRGLVAAATDPIAGGRQRVIGHPDLAVIPTGGSHLPRAVGLAYAIEHARRTPAPRSAPRPPWPTDAVVVCSFGDASCNQASAQAAFNTAGWFTHQGESLPVLFVCEDNGLGVSAPSPPGWVRSVLESRPGLRYSYADGCDLPSTYAAACAAVEWVRAHRRPAVLHLDLVRLMGHADGDPETQYRTAADLDIDLSRDPVVAAATLLVRAGLCSREQAIEAYDQVGWEVRRLAEEVMAEPKLASTAEVTGPLAPRRPTRVAKAVADAADLAQGSGQALRQEVFKGRLPEKSGPLTLAATINAALTDALLANPSMIVFGQDVAARGGVHGVTLGLRDRFGQRRVFDMLLDETSTLGLALGTGLGGLLPVPEIQHLAYLHSAEDQLRAEAAVLQFLSSGSYRNPMVVRVAGLGHQDGAVEDPRQRDNSVAVLRDIPGLVVAVPSCAEAAAPLLRTCLAAAEVDGAVCVFLEPAALYHTSDLHTPDDNGWLAPYAPPADWARDHVALGRARVYGQGEHLTVLTFGNGVRMSLRVAARLSERGVRVRVVDLRWLQPLPKDDLVREAGATGRVLIVDETRRSGGVGEGILATLVDAGFVGAVQRVCAEDSLVPHGPAAAHVQVSEETIEQAARSLLGT